MNEIDRLVAEKVLGWEVCKERSPYRWRVPLSCRLYREWHEGIATNAPPLSTDIAAAWVVVKHLQDQTKEDDTRRFLVSLVDSPEFVEAQVEDLETGDVWVWCVDTDKVPRAICVTALLAYDVPEDQINAAIPTTK